MLPQTLRKRIWLITVGEPLPNSSQAARLLRTGLLAGVLAERGHEVVWWTGSFDHTSKRFWPEAGVDRCGSATDPGYTIRFLQSTGYQRNISIARLRDHAAAAASFTAQAKASEPPDVILCSLPTLELCEAAATYARAQRVPLALDVRDLWPDVFYTALPTFLRPLGPWLMGFYERSANRALQQADAITACSSGYLNWGLRRAKRVQRPQDRVFALGNVKPKSSTPNDLDPALAALLKQGKKLIVFAGVFGHSYDLFTPIEAARQLQTPSENSAIKTGDVVFVFAGRGDKLEPLIQQAAGLNNVFFTGWIGSVQLNALLDSAWLGLAAYHAHALQSLPNKPFDYLSHGLPILNSLNGELAELVEAQSIGFNYPSGDAVALVATVRRLLQEPHLVQRAGLRSKALFDEQFDAAHIYPQFADYLEQLAISENKALS